MKTLLILGGDKLSSEIVCLSEVNAPDIRICIDKSTNITRIFRLLARNKLSLALVTKMLMCEMLRSASVCSDRVATLPRVHSNQDVLQLIMLHKPDRVVLFRAGLIINQEILAQGVPILNIHCARIPEYGGLGAIQRALRESALKQCATLHRVIATIDSGDVIDTEDFDLSNNVSYCANENTAYLAGIRLLQRTLSD